MPISMVLKSYQGKVVRVANCAYVRGPIDESSPNVLLDGIDFYGDTIFNVRQMSRLLFEVERELENAVGDRRESLLELAELCRAGIYGKPHNQLWFIGD